MTGSFDSLGSIYYFAKASPAVRKVALWLADICIAQADKKKEGFNFESRLRSDLAAYLYSDKDDLIKKYEYLDDCHDVLDHAAWHLKVFDPQTQSLIKIIDDALTRDDIYGVDKLKRCFPELGYASLVEEIRKLTPPTPVFEVFEE